MKKRSKIILCLLILFFCILLSVFHDRIRNFVEGIIVHMTEYRDVIFVDFEENTGRIKTLNGINNGPKNGYSENGGVEEWELDATELYQEMNIPIVRTHDSEYPYGQGKFIDIHCVFPDFSKDVDDPSSYDFTYTDKYIQAIIESGAQVFFRLGESIDHSGDNLYINPPEDYQKWAEICEHIIRHYNAGWADGYEYNIKYWEIWNEPDNLSMWTGTLEEYFELYKITANYLKDIYPDIYIGGYAASECSQETITAFLQYLQSDGEKTPLDFFSWHTYTADPSEYMENAVTVRQILDANGYEETISILDEWNYVNEWGDLDGITNMVRSAEGASFIAASLIAMQYSPVDMAMYYDGQFAYDDFAWCGLYGSEAEKLSGYYVFRFFDQLYQQGEQVKINKSKTLDNIYALAATGTENYILLTNYSDEEKQSYDFRLSFSGDKRNVVITRINEEFPEGETTRQRLYFNELVLNIKSGETVFIEITE